VLALLVKGGSAISTVGQLKNRVVSVNAPKDIGTLLIDSLLLEHGVKLNQVHFANNVPFPAVATVLTAPKSPISASFAPEPFVSLGEAAKGLTELADLDQGSTQGRKSPTPTAPPWKPPSSSTWASRRRTRRSSRCRPSRWGLTRRDSSAW
jgi:ABC-type nitrate/sulfonate/bicarbonate transport system substrate-binding protein